MATVEDMLAQALTHHRAGRLNEADLFYRQILTDWPNNPDALHRFGVLAAHMCTCASTMYIAFARIVPEVGTRLLDTYARFFDHFGPFHHL